jgi:2-C-methyl-D-erythritol 4-phosphate cytidylyltransferase
VASKVWAIVVAGGSGVRYGALKQFELIGDREMVEWAARTAGSVCDGVVTVVPNGHEGPDRVIGGATRSESVRCGLAAVPSTAEIIVIHDGARPFASTDLFHAVIDAVDAGADGAIPGVAVTDTIKRVDGGVVVETPDRNALVAVQTPQAFRASVLRRAHASGADATDDAALVEALGGRVVVVPGSPDNRKITVAADLDWARQRVAVR